MLFLRQTSKKCLGQTKVNNMYSQCILVLGLQVNTVHKKIHQKFGTLRQNWDFIGTNLGLWSQLGLSPKFGTSLKVKSQESNPSKTS